MSATGIERPNLCPFCGYRATHVDVAAGDETPLPVEGDVSLCIGCGEFSFFSGPGARVLRRPTAAEAAELAADADMIRTRQAWREMVRTLGRATGGYHKGGQA